MATQRESALLFESESLVLPKAKNIGFMVDEAAPTFPWMDKEGLIYVDGANPATNPTVSLFRTGIYANAYSSGDLCHFSFHMPHDYVPGSDLFIHVHWAHNATGVAANTITWDFDISYAKGFNQANFSTPITPQITYALVDITTTPQYRHRIDEIQLSAASPTAAQLASDDLEVDGLIIGTMEVTIPSASFSGGTPDEAIYIFTIDLHYQSTGIGTKAKVGPAFYT